MPESEVKMIDNILWGFAGAAIAVGTMAVILVVCAIAEMRKKPPDDDDITDE